MSTDDPSAAVRGSEFSDGLGLDPEREAVLAQLDDRTNQTWAGKRARWAKLVRAQHAEIDRLRERVVELEADPKSGDVIPLAEPRCGDLRRSAERCITAWTVVRGGVWDPNGLMDEHMAALRKALGPNARVQQPQVGWNEVLGFRATNTALLADLLCYINCTRHGGANRSKK